MKLIICMYLSIVPVLGFDMYDNSIRPIKICNNSSKDVSYRGGTINKNKCIEVKKKTVLTFINKSVYKDEDLEYSKNGKKEKIIVDK